MDFDKDKFKMTLHYIIYKCGFRNTVGRTVLHKLLYFSDFNYFQKYGQSITNESYRKMERGPVPIHFEDAIAELVDEDKVRLGKRRLPCGKIMNRYFSLEKPSIDLKKEELEVINQVIKDLSHMNGKQIGEYSLADEPVKRTDSDEFVEYDLVFSRTSKEKSKVFVKIS
ncbi:MAG: Panacea domain-containing protein [Methanobrevibacter sp.]|nr:Panacea domain-containing protein [Methanobrevibacter sp.]